MGKSGFLHWPSKVRPWPSDFPQVVTHISLQRLQSTARGAGEELDEAGKSMAYRYAKAGDAEAARRVVEDVLKPELVLMLNRQFPEAIVDKGGLLRVRLVGVKEIVKLGVAAGVLAHAVSFAWLASAMP